MDLARGRELEELGEQRPEDLEAERLGSRPRTARPPHEREHAADESRTANGAERTEGPPPRIAVLTTFRGVTWLPVIRQR